MQLIRKFRIPALFCALAVLICELVSRPYAEMGVSDDGPYIVMAQHLAATGHVVYNGWAAPMLTWQLYFAAAFIKLFGFSFTTVRMSTLLIAMALAFVLQRALVRAGITERNATIGGLALVLSPLYLMLSVTFMTDIQGLFAIVVCLYSCLRVLQAPTYRATMAWLCFAVVSNSIFGTSRQIAWLGILVMVPSTLWLLRAERRVLVAGAAVTLAGFLFIFACTQWLKHQPYIVTMHLIVYPFSVFHVFRELTDFFLDIPFLLLPITALFLPEIRKSGPRVIAIVSTVVLGYLLLALHPHYLHHIFALEPAMWGEGNWVGVHGIHEGLHLQGVKPIFLRTDVQVLLTIVSLGGLMGLIVSLLLSRRKPPLANSPAPISWKQLGALLAPFSLAYIILLIPSAATGWIFDRYALALLVVALFCLVRYYQEQIQPWLPFASILLVGIMAIYGITVTHNMFALYRARVALAAELRAAGIPDTSVDNGFEYNFSVELQHANHINTATIAVPPDAYVLPPPLPSGTCPMFWYDHTPHIHPRYGISFDPNVCYGPAPFAPITYSRWLASSPGTLYVVNYTPPSAQ